MWLYKGEEFTSDDIKQYYGFTYCITNNITKKQYIGRKYFYSITRKKPLKGNKRKRVIKVESNWKDYYGSCDELTKDVTKYGKALFSREILGLYKTKGQTNYNETRLLFQNDVINSKMYYNTSIMGRWFGDKK